MSNLGVEFKSPTAAEVAQAKVEFSGKALRLFNLVLRIIRIPECIKRLRCSFMRDKNNRWQEMCLLCLRQLSRHERRKVRCEILWLQYVQDISQSDLHYIMYLNEMTPDDDQDFQVWLNSQKKTRLARIFYDFSQRHSHIGMLQFSALWNAVSEGAQNRLLALWWRVIICACGGENNVKSVSIRGRKEYFLCLPPLNVPEPL